MMKSYATLLRREWLQHKFGWTVIVFAPLVIALIVIAAGQLDIDIDDEKVRVQFERVPALALAAAAIVATAAVTFVIAWLIAVIQAPGLARRDHQDRSVEFWLSLPTSHTASLTAPMLAHLLLFPLAALGIGIVSGHLVSLLLVTRWLGIGEWLTLPWGSLLLAVTAAAARLTLGVVLATVWLSPLLLLAMAASAWLKRWGLPALVVGLAVLGGLLSKVFGIPIVGSTVVALLQHARQALIGPPRPSLFTKPKEAAAAAEQIGRIPQWMGEDALRAIGELASPLLLLALAISAGCFALLVLRRQRGA